MKWKIIKDYENYEVSDSGLVRNRKTGRELKGLDNRGYLRVCLYKYDKQTFKSIHRLVAETFIPNPDKKPEVNHINEIKCDNRIENLEWMTSKENMNYGNRSKRQAVSKSKPIIVIYRDNTYEYYPSATICAEELGLWKGNINSVIKGRRKTAGGLRFEYAGSNYREND